MTFSSRSTGELRRLRDACNDLGVDEEMTDLVIASHRHDRSALDRFLSDGRGVHGYVGHMIGKWETILSGSLDNVRTLICHSDAERATGLQAITRPRTCAGRSAHSE